MHAHIDARIAHQQRPCYHHYTDEAGAELHNQERGERRSVCRVAGGKAVSATLDAMHKGYELADRIVGIGGSQAAYERSDDMAADLVCHEDGKADANEGKEGALPPEAALHEEDQEEVERYPHPLACDNIHELVEKRCMVAVGSKEQLFVKRSDKIEHDDRDKFV